MRSSHFASSRIPDPPWKPPSRRQTFQQYSTLPVFPIPGAANVWPIFVCFASQQLCLLFCFFYIPFFLQLYAATFWAKMRLCGRVTVVNEEEADCRMVIFSTQDSKHIQSEEKRSHRNEKHFVLGMEMENDNGAMETCHSFIT